MAEAPSEAPEAPEAPSSKSRRMMLRIAVFATVAAIAAVFVYPAAPREQHLRLHLGSGSSLLVGASARIGRGGAWDRATTWHFDAGAPPSIAWDFELPNGGADVEIELSTKSDSVTKKVHVELSGGDTTVELADAMKGLP
jgi:hypothetical protein